MRARVTSKSDVKHWSNARGEGSLFSVELLDSSGTDIRATFFKEGVDKFYSMIEADKVYTFSGGRLQDIEFATAQVGEFGNPFGQRRRSKERLLFLLAGRFCTARKVVAEPFGRVIILEDEALLAGIPFPAQGF